MAGFRFESVAQGVWRLRLIIVNLYAVQTPEGWTLVDTGPPGFAGVVKAAAEAQFGGKPQAIVLTHAHFDHAGNAAALAEAWDVPVVCHELELPYIVGRSDYPPQDPTVGGAMAFSERFFPHGGTNVGDHAQTLPENGEIPTLPGWRWIFTPGHTAGHVSFFRAEDHTLIVGDAFVTTDLDSWFDILAWRKRLCGPVKSFTPDWPAAIASVHRLAEESPQSALSGHGDPWSGSEFMSALEAYAREMAPPEKGRYASKPALYEHDGSVAAVPPPVPDPLPFRLVVTGAAVLVAIHLWRSRRDS